MTKDKDPEDLIENEASGPLSDQEEGMLLRAENAALARYHRWNALSHRARGRGEDRMTPAEEGPPAPEVRTHGGKPTH